jgi:predicted ATPase/DNA-binding CsgD family transcriptional regulator
MQTGDHEKRHRAMADATPPAPNRPASGPRSAALGLPGGAPPELTSFVGRERETSELAALLAGGTRLLTLTGPGGTGKTRLALEAAAEVVERFEDGVWWVELAPISTPDLVPQAVAQVLNVFEGPGRSLTEALADDLRELEIMLVLDNCEHLIDACARLAEALLHACPTLRILATSRELLGIAGERNFPVPPLSLPEAERLSAFENPAGYEAIRLFVDRAQAVVPGFELTEHNAPAVANLCRRLDGIPLAIELAAARVKALTVEQISSRLEGSFALLTGGSRTAMARQRTLRAAIDWSHDLLSEEEKILFRRLSVCSGGFTLDAAEAICAGEDIEPEEVLDLLSGLMAKSLLIVEERDGTARYRLLEIVGQYGREKLEDSGETELVRERHARFYLALAEAAETELREQEAWLRRLETEHANFRAALSWALDRPEGQTEGRAELGLRLAASLAQGRFWKAYGQGEGRRWLERGLVEIGASANKSVRAKALSQAGYLAIYQRSATLAGESMALYKELGDEKGIATSLFHLGQMAVHRGDQELARALRLEAEDLRKVLVDRQSVGLLILFSGMVYQQDGDLDRAEALYEEGLALNRQLGDLRGTAMCLNGLGVSALERVDTERAAAFYEEDIRMLRQLKDKTGTAYGLRGMACVAALRGDAARAARLWGAAEALGESIGLPLSSFDRSHPDYEARLDTVRSRLNDEAAWQAARAEGRAMTTEEAIEYALDVRQAALETTHDSSRSSLLSAREAEILALVAQGLTNPQIARRLYLSPRTVGQHLRSVYRKLGVSSRAAAVREASRRGPP